MQLREHPVFVALGYGFRWWPPAWARIGYGNAVYGEVGMFVGAKINEHLPDRLFLTMEHEGGLYMGALVVKDKALCVQLCEFLENRTGRTIKEIGNLEINFLL